MATQEEASAVSTPPHCAEVVGNAFVQQYYHVLHVSPDLVYRFYHDSSLLSRPNSHDGESKKVTTMEAINDMITSLNYEAEIDTVDSQESHERGVLVLVTGRLTGKDNVQKKFTQSFFLAPQDKGGFFVRNDVLQFVKEKKPFDVDSGLENDIQESASMSPLTADPVPAYIPDEHSVDSIASVEEEKQEGIKDEEVEEDIKEVEVEVEVEAEAEAEAEAEVEDFTKDEGEDNISEICDPSNKEGFVTEEEVVEPSNHFGQNESVVNSVPAIQDDAPKKSYASIVKAMRSSTQSPASVRVPISTRPAATNPDKRFLGSAKPAPKPAPETAALPPLIETPPDITNVQNGEAEGYSVYIRNLPLSATVEQVEEAFKIFGPIKRRGVQVRVNRGFCFGFVEFESLSSMQTAIEATSVTIGDHKVEIEEKKTTSRAGSGGRGGFRSYGRGGFRNDNFRDNRGNFSGRGYGRNEYRNQGEFTGRPTRSSTGRNGDVYQRVTQNEGSRTPVPV